MPRRAKGEEGDLDWFSIAGEADSVLADPSSHGHRSQADALAALVERSGMTATTLRQNIAARCFLLKHYADRLSEHPPTTGCTQILILARLHGAARHEADRIVDDVLDGRITRRRIADLLQRSRSRREHGAVLGARTEGKASAVAFEAAAFGFVEQALDRLARGRGTLARNWRWRGLMADGAIYAADDPSRPLVLIEVKSPRRETVSGRAREIVGQNLLLQRAARETMTVLPWNDALVGLMRALIDAHDISGQHVARIETRPGSPNIFTIGEIMTRTEGQWTSDIVKNTAAT
ncbi:hypothetical protein [Rubrimonas sp.]|uniref:hypothetical protein n=1 Tax=Rubrimonas sp. TaxID=2036015 RepID=UPI002FDDAB5E